MTDEIFFVSHQDRMAMTSMMTPVFSGHIENDKGYISLKGGLKTLHDGINDLYPSSILPESSANDLKIRFKEGYHFYPASESRRQKAQFWVEKIKGIFSKNVFDQNIQINTLIRQNPTDLVALEQDWLRECYETILGPAGLADQYFCWNWLIIKTDPKTADIDMGVSGNWHYDVHYPPSYFKIMFYLNDSSEHHSGTDFLDRNRSVTISSQSEYVGFAQFRVNDLSKISLGFKSNLVQAVRPNAGDAVLFWPSQVMHRGVYPTGSPRYAISFSFMPISPWAQTSDVEQLYRECLQNFVTGTDAPPFFLPKYTHDIRNMAHNWSGVFGHKDTQKFILDALQSLVLAANDPALERQFQIVAHLANFFELGDTNKFIADLKFCCQQIGYSALLELTEEYIRSTNSETDRYPRPDAATNAFWPDPTHPKYPRHLHDIEPFVVKHPILDRTTPIATAGSCFAFEISHVLQENNFNYLIAERPDDISRGVYVDGYQAGDRFVKFSANYGIMFNTPSVLQIAQRAFGVRDFKKLVIPEHQYFVDPYRENVVFRDIESFAQDYPHHTEALRRVFTECEVFVFTLGLNECWRFRDDDTVISRNPRGPIYPLVYHQRLTVEQNVSSLREFYLLCKAHNPKFKLILSVSPIPFLATGMSDKHHVVEANSHSKSVLRVAAQELVDTFEDIYYFPSYEMVMHTLESPWENDLRHIKREAVQKIVAVFNKMFGREK